MKSSRRLIWAWLPTLVWLVVIAFESTEVFTAANTQSWLTTVWRLLGSTWLITHAAVVNHVLRKTGHFTGYGLLSAFAFYSWSETLHVHLRSVLRRAGKMIDPIRRWHFRAAALAVLTTFLVASADEFHQGFLPGRTSAFADVLLDTAGGIFVQCLIVMLWASWTRRSKQSVQLAKAGSQAAASPQP